MSATEWLWLAAAACVGLAVVAYVHGTRQRYWGGSPGELFEIFWTMAVIAAFLATIAPSRASVWLCLPIWFAALVSARIVVACVLEPNVHLWSRQFE